MDHRRRSACNTAYTLTCKMQVKSLVSESEVKQPDIKDYIMSEETKPAYGLVQINITNQEEFMERYAQHVFPILAAWGIEMIAGSTSPITKEGSFTGNWSAVLRFPSMAVAEEWYVSDDYAPYRDLRMNELTDSGSLVFIEGM